MNIYCFIINSAACTSQLRVYVTSGPTLVDVNTNELTADSFHLFFLCSVCERGLFNCTQEHCEEVNPCPGALIYSPRSCLLTCSSLDPPGQQQQGGSSVGQSSCKEPLSGCVCPQGTVLLVGDSSDLAQSIWLKCQNTSAINDFSLFLHCNVAEFLFLIKVFIMIFWFTSG